VGLEGLGGVNTACQQREEQYLPFARSGFWARPGGGKKGSLRRELTERDKGAGNLSTRTADLQ